MLFVQGSVQLSPLPWFERWGYIFFLLFHGIISAKAVIILILWPDDPQAKPAPVLLANDTTPLRFMV